MHASNCLFCLIVWLEESMVCIDCTCHRRCNQVTRQIQVVNDSTGWYMQACLSDKCSMCDAHQMGTASGCQHPSEPRMLRSAHRLACSHHC
jgi:hypothetical protein